jgi:propanol-preferring alcohol dehydrogenase
MRVMAIASGGRLQADDRPEPNPGPGQVRIRIRACAVCHTELDELEGRLTAPPGRIPGHQIVGFVDALGDGVGREWLDRRVGVGWIFHACGRCEACRRGLENQCPSFVSTGCDVDGGYAEAMVAPTSFVHPLPDVLTDVEAAPLLCAGAIGFRALERTRLTDGEPLGLTGFGASGHLVLSLARVRYPRSPVFVFARSASEREFALERGAAWAGTADETAPQPLAAIIDTTPVWTPVVRALEQLAPGGRLVINAIRKESIDQKALLELDYARHFWREKTLTTVANVTRADIRKCLDAAAQGHLRADVTTYPLEEANTALADLKRGGSRGAKVLLI